MTIWLIMKSHLHSTRKKCYYGKKNFCSNTDYFLHIMAGWLNAKNIYWKENALLEHLVKKALVNKQRKQLCYSRILENWETNENIGELQKPKVITDLNSFKFKTHLFNHHCTSVKTSYFQFACPSPCTFDTNHYPDLLHVRLHKEKLKNKTIQIILCIRFFSAPHRSCK